MANKLWTTAERIAKEPVRWVRGRARRSRVHRKSKDLAFAPEVVSPAVTTAAFGPFGTADLVADCLRIDGQVPIERVWNDHVMFGGAMEGMIDRFDVHVLCGMIRLFNVTRVIECSPNKGWSTTFIQLSLGNDPRHLSFDTEDYRDDIARAVQRHTVLRNWQFVRGDFKRTILDQVNELSSMDLLFLDSDHSADVARWYLDEFSIIDRLPRGALVHIHDVYPPGLEPKGFGGYDAGDRPLSMHEGLLHPVLNLLNPHGSRVF